MTKQDGTTAPNAPPSNAGPSPGRNTADPAASGNTSAPPIGRNPDTPAHQATRHGAEGAETPASDARSHIREGAADVGEKLKSRAFEEADRRKDDAADSLHVFADTIRSAADDLSRKDQSAAARVIREAARGLESLSRTIHERSAADASRSIADFGRRHPVALMAGGLLGGLAVGRFLKASSDDHDNYEMRRSGTEPRPFDATQPEDAMTAATSRSGRTAGESGGTDAGPHQSASARLSRVDTPATPPRSTAVLGEKDGNA